MSVIKDLEAARLRVQESEERLRRLGDNLPNGIVYQIIRQPDGKRRFLYISAGLERLLGIPPQAVMNDPGALYERVVEQDRGRLAEAEEASYRQLTVFNLEVRINTVRGELRWMYLSSAPRRMPGGAVLWDGIQIDITERKQAEAALSESEERFRSLFENAVVGFYRTTPDGRILMANPALLSMLGYASLEELAARNLEQEGFEPNYSREEFKESLAREGQVTGLEAAWKRRDGSVLHVSENCRAVRDDSGHILYYNGSVEDITERKRAEQALRDAESLYHSLVEHLPQCVFRKNREGKFTYVNRHYCAMMGKTADEILGRTVFDLLAPEAAEKHGRDEQRVMETQMVLDSIEDGMLVGNPKSVVHVVKAPVRNASGEVLGVQGILTDITSQRELEAKFLRVQRLESIGSLASGIAHDLNNILAPIMMSVPLLRGQLPDEEREEMLSLIEASTQRAVGIVKQLLTFGRGQVGQKTPLQVRHILREVRKIAQETFPRSIQVESDFAAELWLVNGDATQLHQVLLNLCVNARDAMPAGGKLTLRAENVHLIADSAGLPKDVPPGPFVRIRVEDTGTGIPDAVREHIFDSFFTTKSQDQGTGLGLTTVLGIVKNHQGFIAFTTAEGRGTTFEVHLPALPQGESSLQPEQPAAAAPRAGGELVLLVDDEPAVRNAVRRALERHGYQVLQAQDGIDALAQFTSRRYEIKAVVTDVMMPQMDGVMLSRTLRHLSPQTPIIVSTGGLLARNSDDFLQTLEAMGISHILHKPHGAEVLLAALDEVLHPAGVAPPGPRPKFYPLPG